jgi:hypothetical protein
MGRWVGQASCESVFGSSLLAQRSVGMMDIKRLICHYLEGQEVCFQALTTPPSYCIRGREIYNLKSVGATKGIGLMRSSGQYYIHTHTHICPQKSILEIACHIPKAARMIVPSLAEERAKLTAFYPGLETLSRNRIRKPHVQLPNTHNAAIIALTQA